MSKVLIQFDFLDQSLIDTSSIIYLNKINLLSASSQKLHLMTIPGVVEEFGSLSELKYIKVINIKEIHSVKQDTDQNLLETAKYFQLPIISEDKKILMQAKHIGLSFFNTLMIMNFLIYKKVINQTAYQAAHDQLREEAYYDETIFEYGKKVYKKIMNNNLI
ncbi:hypothetical protein KAH27_05485 [bacterium]|nr:hypothetical protein [bacterium]